MLSPSKMIGAALLVAAAPLVNSGIKADVKNTEPTKVQSMARIVKQKPQTSTLRCWQEGRLIFQSKSISGSSDPAKAAVALAAKGKSIQLMDFRNGLCILEQVNKRKKKSKK